MGRSLKKIGNQGADRVLWMDYPKATPRTSRSRGRRSDLLALTFLMFLVIVGCLFFVWSRIQVIQLGYEISKALKQGKALEETQKQLRIEIAMLKSYSRVERIAKEELKMSKPKPEQVIIIR